MRSTCSPRRLAIAAARSRASPRTRTCRNRRREFDCRSNVELPSLDGATGWLNSAPLTAERAAGKGGRARRLDLYLHQLAAHAYLCPRLGREIRDQGLVVIGVHSPEFAFENDIDNVRRAAKDMHVDYPIAIDNDYAIWRALNNEYWPALYIVDARGRIRYHHFGEGEYEQSESVIQQLLSEAGAGGMSRAWFRSMPAVWKRRPIGAA